jgi:polyketide synthase 5
VQYANGSWLLISTTPTADVLTTTLTDTLKTHGAQCSTMCWPRQGDFESNAVELQDHLRTGGFDGVVIMTGPENGGSAEVAAPLGRELVQHLVRIAGELPGAPGEPRMYVVTRAARAILAGEEPDLEQAGLRGLMRVIAIEHPHLIASQIDVDETTEAECLAQQLLSGSEEDETAWRNGDWYVARLTPAPLLPDERQTTSADHEDAGMRLQIRTPGDLESMELVACERIAPGPGQIEVAVNASSINFADVLVAFGRYPAFDGHLPQLGIDFAGVVSAVGPGVSGHKVGDRVGGLSANGCWGTFILCDADLAVTLPAGLGDAEAAALTIATATAWYGLNDMARITADDKVLIHSGTGGVGQAAIAIARAAGAEIFATAGSEQRRQLLRDKGIEHVYDSRSTAFADQIRGDTEGYGVDIVLNSVTGSAQRAGLELLAFGGRFVEIGKRDIYGDTRLGLFPFRRNLSFYAVDLALMSVSHPGLVRKL